ncbi:uncharacterized protein SPAPADRAFT_49441 [Spathaspora passalidarum NRRL Y-27907]|uniref:Kinetochore protein NDC80 n=1 Tax=Spathaspora passalidarum (strain NRRL Y-27907 / 11-Y1) TaxID=619300 RepID=G3AI82_SPAPN|nr:uncharacterized protein SPAPADRAFT_49441 [Spathaspora passalidarum NRRL Y-27907]EGW34396.1 hypothetical protein SPAPADRAFT_49441 [Spathaspora passalidarum NRRL Y-27907]
MAPPRLFQNDPIDSSGTKLASILRTVESSSRRTNSLTPVTKRGVKRRSLIASHTHERGSIENDRRESVFFSTPARVNKKRPSPGPSFIKARPQLHTHTAALTNTSSSFMPSSSSVAGPQQQSLRSTPALSSRASAAQAPLGGGSSLVTPSSQQSLAQRDPRPLRDRKYQELIQAEIHSFLTENRFELEPSIKLTESTLKTPTQKEFTGIFSFLVKMQNPSFKLGKAPDTEIYTALKVMNYPYLDSISRSQIGAVGGQNWPTFLGVLYWLVTVNLKLLRITEEDETPEDEDRLHDEYHAYISSKYARYLAGRDNENDEIELQEKLDRMKVSAEEQLQEYSHNKNAIEEAVVHLEADGKIIETAVKKSEDLYQDFDALKNYIESRKNSKPKYDEILANLKQAAENESRLLEEARVKVVELQAQLEQLGISQEFIQGLRDNRDQADKEFADAEEQYMKLREDSITAHEHFARDIDRLKQSVRDLNSLSQLFNPDFQLELNKDIKTSNTFTRALKPDEILTRKTSEVKIEFVSLKSRLTSLHGEYRDTSDQLKTERDKITDVISLLESKRDEARRKVDALQREYDREYASMQQKQAENKVEIARLETDLVTRQSDARNSLLNLEKANKDAREKHNKIVADISSKRSILNSVRSEAGAIALKVQTNTQENLLRLDDKVQEESIVESDLRNELN